MRSNYKRLGDYIQPVNIKNKDLEVTKLLGVSIKKIFIPSIANTIGTNMKTYKIIKKNQFAYGPVTSRNGDKISIALLEEFNNAIISQAYTVFEIMDKNLLSPEYLMMWFRRPEFDRYARYKSHGSARETFDWDEMFEVKLPVPSIEKQNEIVKEYNTVVNRIKLNEKLNKKLEETAQAIYKEWFENFEFPNEEGRPYKSSGGKMVWNEELEKEIPEGWKDFILSSKCNKIGSGSTPRGGKESYKKNGISLIRSMNVYNFNFKFNDLAFIDEKQAGKLNNVEVFANDILFNITGASVARCCKVPLSVLPARVNQHVAIIRAKDLGANYLLCTLCSLDNKRKLLAVTDSGSTREAITKDDLDNFKILFPTKHVLKKFEQLTEKQFNYKFLLSEEIIKNKQIQILLLSKMSKYKV